jgi:uncharacterized coiled-coil protein SlyX
MEVKLTMGGAERYNLLKSSITAQADELKALSGRNNELEIYVRQQESKIGELSSSLATYSGNLSKAQSEAQLLRSEKALQKVCSYGVQLLSSADVVCALLVT